MSDKNTDNKLSKQVHKAILILIFILPGTFSKSQTRLLDAIDKKDTIKLMEIVSSRNDVNKRKLLIRSSIRFKKRRHISTGRKIKYRRRGPILSFWRTEPALTQAVFKGNYFFTKLLLEHGAKPNRKGNYVLTPLGWAAHEGDLETVKLLLEYGADINGSEKSWRTSPLIESIEKKHWDIAKFLLDKGANIAIEDRDGKTALSHAAIQKNYEIVKLLVDKGADVNHITKNENSVLENACSGDILFAEKNTNFDVIKHLVQHGAKTDDQSINIAARKGEFEIVKYLISKGAIVIDNLLLSAANGKSFELFKYLVDSLHLNIHYEDSTKGGPENVLQVAANGYWGDSSIRRVNIKLLEYILHKDVDVNKANQKGQTPLLLLVEYGKRDNETKVAAELLIKKGAMVNVFGGDMKFSPLMHAAYQSQVETAKLLIEHGADVNFKDYVGRPILHWASWRYNNQEMIKLLVEAGADINAKEPGDGETAAMDCVVFTMLENIRELIELGADPNIKANTGHTLLELIRDEEFRQYLISKGAKSGRDIK